MQILSVQESTLLFGMIYNKLAVKHEVGIVCFNRRAGRHAVLARPAC